MSFGIANFGLTTIVSWCVPVLMFLYPLAITLILLSLSGKLIGTDQTIYRTTTAFTLIAAVFDMIGTISGMVPGSQVLAGLKAFAEQILPLYDLGLGWILPAVIGFLVGLWRSKRKA